MKFASRFPKMRLIFMHTGVTVYPYSNYRAGMIMYTSGLSLI
ncbi:cell division inhibitor SulA, partial [Klebsiella pneumoniae]